MSDPRRDVTHPRRALPRFRYVAPGSPGVRAARRAGGGGDVHGCWVQSGATMTTRIPAVFAAALLLTSLTAPVLAEKQAQAQSSADQQPPKKKHSKLKGAVVGGAGGALVGGKKGAA